jgi:DNA-binding NarL/FixJ family response regulator
MIRVLIADDHAALRENLRLLLEEQQPFWEVSEASNGQDAIDQFRKDMPDVAVLDIVMTPVGGVAAAYEMWRIDPKAKIVFISGQCEPADASIVTCILKAGSFVPKSDAVKLLVPTIKRMLNNVS